MNQCQKCKCEVENYEVDLTCLPNGDNTTLCNLCLRNLNDWIKAFLSMDPADAYIECECCKMRCNQEDLKHINYFGADLLVCVECHLMLTQEINYYCSKLMKGE